MIPFGALKKTRVSLSSSAFGHRRWHWPFLLEISGGNLSFFWPTGATLKVNNMGDIGFRDGNGKRDREKECVFGFGRERFRGEFQFLDSCGNCLCFHIEYLQSNLYYIMTVFFQLTTSAELSSDATHQRLKKGQLITFSRAQGAPKGAMACWTWYVNNCKWKHAYLQYIRLLNVLIIHNYYIYIYTHVDIFI